MSVLLKKVLWYSVDNPDVAINITDSIVLNVGRGLDIKNNVVTITVKNSIQSFDTNEKTVHRYVNSDGTLSFKEDDQIKVYLKYTDDMIDVESLEWNNNPDLFSGIDTAEPSADDLLGVYFVIEFDTPHDIKGTKVSLKCADKSFILFNRLLASNFPLSDNLTVPRAIQKVVRFASQKGDGLFEGTGEDFGVMYDVDARLDTETDGGDGSGEAGFIQSTRRATYEDPSQGVNPDTLFPEIALAKIWKPVYEWIGELSQIEFTNTSDELSNNLVYGRPFIFWVDENNKFHWVEANNTISDTIEVGVTPGLISHKISKSVFDVQNFIVFRAGADLYGNGVLYYYVDETSNVGVQKMRVVAMKDIAYRLIKQEKIDGNIVQDDNGPFNFEGRRFSRVGDPTPAWSNTSYTTDASYNKELRRRAKEEGITKSRRLVNQLSSARFKGPLDRKGINGTVGEVFDLIDRDQGILQSATEKIRLIDIRHTVNKTGWFSQYNLEQDQIAILEGANQATGD